MSTIKRVSFADHPQAVFMDEEPGMCGDLVRYSKAERRMMLEPLVGLWRRWLRDR